MNIYYYYNIYILLFGGVLSSHPWMQELIRIFHYNHIYIYIYTHTIHTRTYIYIYICVCVCIIKKILSNLSYRI